MFRNLKFTVKAADIVVALIIFIVGLIVIVDSMKVGSGWGSDGPKPGYFTFYIGIILCLSSVVTIIYAFVSKKVSTEPFIGEGRLKPVLAVFIPTLVYVILIFFLGFYVSTFLFIIYFLKVMGKFGWLTILPISIAVPVVIFLIFEIWFLIPLPKGPLENLLGL